MIVEGVKKVVIHYESGDVEEYNRAEVNYTRTVMPDTVPPTPVRYLSVIIPLPAVPVATVD